MIGKTKNSNGREGYTKVDISRVCEVVKECEGIVTNIAKKLKLSRGAIYDYKKKYPEVKEAFEDTQEDMIDVCEFTLYTKAKEGEFQSLKYFLDNKARHRGYGEKLDLTNSDGNLKSEPSVIVWEAVDKKQGDDD